MIFYQTRKLADNFPLCYYAGGSKFLPGETATIETRSASTNLIAGQRRRLEQRLDALQTEWDLLSKKVKKMREALVIEAGTAVKFQLEQQLLNEEANLAHLSNEMEQIESTLQL